ncbi:MAG: channel protein hemolysin family [Verrucomicrobia bacterium]|nr:channel protein hemolysin family [Verrucomicrobiota bacterium]
MNADRSDFMGKGMRERRGGVTSRQPISDFGGSGRSVSGVVFCAKSGRHSGMVPATVYTRREELANIATHGVGIVLSLIGLAWVVTLSSLEGDAWQIVGTTIFGVTLVLLYTTSTLYHGFRHERRKQIMRKFDHAAIFLLIAGSYTPFLLVSLRGLLGWILFGVVWGLAVVGIALKFRYAGRFRVVSTLIYIAMGWLVLTVFGPLSAALPSTGVWLLVAGGLCYTGGAAFYLWKRLPYHHAVWHLCVMAGSICHWSAVFLYVVPRPLAG